jgi:hypothetical protein
MSAFIFLIVFGKEQSGSLEVAVYNGRRKRGYEQREVGVLFQAIGALAGWHSVEAAQTEEQQQR